MRTLAVMRAFEADLETAESWVWSCDGIYKVVCIVVAVHSIWPAGDRKEIFDKSLREEKTCRSAQSPDGGKRMPGCEVP